MRFDKTWTLLPSCIILGCLVAVTSSAPTKTLDLDVNTAQMLSPNTVPSCHHDNQQQDTGSSNNVITVGGNMRISINIDFISGGAKSCGCRDRGTNEQKTPPPTQAPVTTPTTIPSTHQPTHTPTHTINNNNNTTAPITETTTTMTYHTTSNVATTTTPKITTTASRSIPDPTTTDQQHTTTQLASSSAPTATTTQSPTTSSTMKVASVTTDGLVTSTEKTTKCYTCSDLTCQTQTSISCPFSKSLCMNTITQDVTGARTFIKGCATNTQCHDLWWVKTAGLADCFLLDDQPKGPPGMSLEQCHLCCKGDHCNKHAVPEVNTLWEP